jgi:hypothetical protein
MKAIFPSLLWACLFLSPCGGQPPAAAPRPATAGKVLVLENENPMEGEVERVGDQYRVRRVVGETWVPAASVLGVCGSLEEAYRFVRARANLRDPDERLRLARWCRANGLHDQALDEVRAAVQLRPGHAETRRLLDHLEQAAAVARAAPPSRPPAPEGPTPAIDLTADSLGLFATRVQPILMNTCAGCHTPTHPGAFKLARAYEIGLGNRKTLQHNLAAVLAQVNFGAPQASPLLTKAVSDHARVGQAPLRSRKEGAYRALEDWVRVTLDNNPLLREQQPGTSAAEGEPTPPAPRPAPARADDGPRPPAPAAPAPPAVKPPPAPPDPFDPEEFNRAMHPEKAKPK